MPWALRVTDVDRHSQVNNAVCWQAVEELLPALGVDPRLPLPAELDYRRPVDSGESRSSWSRSRWTGRALSPSSRTVPPSKLSPASDRVRSTSDGRGRTCLRRGRRDLRARAGRINGEGWEQGACASMNPNLRIGMSRLDRCAFQKIDLLSSEGGVRFLPAQETQAARLQGLFE